ncbi:MAG: hypothetical protein IT518_14760 [Burkholderiales bacterium]|nr:hypothetical protein [Burkholderiales bacterium]
MRIIYDNAADTAFIEDLSGWAPLLPAQNLATKEREVVWRGSANHTVATLGVHLDGASGTGEKTPVQCVVFYNTNFADGGWRVWVYEDASKMVVLYDSGNVDAPRPLPFGDLVWGVDPLGKGVYTDWGFSNIAMWLPQIYYSSYVEIELSFNPPDNYLQASRLFVGSYWEVTHAPKRGMQLQWVDTSKPQRTEGGTVHVELGIQYRRLAVAGDWMTEDERRQIVDLIRKRGLHGDVFVSVFADEGGIYERDHEMQAVLASLEPMTLPQYGYVNFAFLFEEI